MKQEHKGKVWLKRLVLSLPMTNRWYEKGYMNQSIRRQRFVNWLFKTVFKVNIYCPWSVHFTSQVIIAKKIRIGKGVEKSFMFSAGCYIQGGNGIEIGDGTIFAPGVKIISANHDPMNLDQWLPDKPIKIGKNCWIGANAVILPGVELGDNVVVGAGALVTKRFPSDVLLVGNPARITNKASTESASLE